MTTPAIAHRLHQIAFALTRRRPQQIDPKSFPNDHVLRLFLALHPHDQRHLLEVERKAQGADLPENFRRAALLHDIGKVTLCGTCISLWARIAHVILQRAFPTAGVAFSRFELLGTGPRLARDHGRLGADRLRALGVAEEICAIVERHDDHSQEDPELRLLQEIDSATP